MNSIIYRFRLGIIESNKFGCGKIIGPVLSCLLNLLIRHSYSKQLMFCDNILKYFSNPIVEYYRSLAMYLNGNYDYAELILTKLIQKKESNVECYYLLASVFIAKGEKRRAWDLLVFVLDMSTRMKTWLYLSNLVDEMDEYDELLSIWFFYTESGKFSALNYDLNIYITTAALRAKNYDSAIIIWNKFNEHVQRGQCHFPAIKQDKICIKCAKNALIQLNLTLKENRINFFLISGTLLGCIRENNILKHDKDIDVGVWEDVDLLKIKQILSMSGVFTISAMRSEHVLRVKHVNGVAIDIFKHYRESDNYWHGGVKLIWNNTPFKLVNKKFLGTDFYVPENYDLYLTENYGDWKSEKKGFDSAMDTTNAVIACKTEMKIHLLRKLSWAIYLNDAKGKNNIAHLISSL
ncbi:tetratricopeptide repeat protein [Citrobacter braakii]|uniref:tetratricopeptide repeat protein n=1 Tax=Citrobacter braakii TaxID=57706 RepID=UPI0011B049FC|nr:hypothetical protein [Citrobacter braakii]